MVWVNNQHLKELAEGVNNIADDQEIVMSGTQFKEMMLGFLEFSDSPLENKEQLHRFLQRIKDART